MGNAAIESSNRYQDPAELMNIDLVTDLFPSPEGRPFDVRLWNGRLLRATSSQVPLFTLVLTHPGAICRIFLPP